MKRMLSSFFAWLEYSIVWIVAKACGVSTAVRYLRNPAGRNTVRVLRAFGATVGSQVTLKGSMFIDNVFDDQDSTGDFSHLKIGENCYIGDCVFFDLANEVVIEDNAVISGNVSLITHAECNRSPFLSKKFPRKCKPIVVGSGAWVCFGATVLPGVTIGRNSVIGAHSLLFQDAEAQWMYTGIPAKKLRRIE